MLDFIGFQTKNKCWIFLDDGAGVAQFIKDESWRSGVRMCSVRDVFPCPTRDSNSRSLHQCQTHGGFLKEYPNSCMVYKGKSQSKMDDN